MKLIDRAIEAGRRPDQIQVRVGEPAPDFELSGTHGTVTLSSLQGQWVVLYFYPENDTPGCTLEAKRFRDYFEALSRQQAAVVGISKDSYENHCQFRDRLSLPFELVADPEGSVHDIYGAWRRPVFGKDKLKTRRCTFLIDPRGVVRTVYDKVNPATHAAQVVRDLEALVGLT